MVHVERSQLLRLGESIRQPKGEPASTVMPSSWTRLGMSLLQGMLRKLIREGRLTVIGPDGRSYGVGSGAPSVTIRIVDPAVVLRLLAHCDLALGEAYMDGGLAVEDGDIYELLALCVGNLHRTDGHWLRSLRRVIGRACIRLKQYNPIEVARRNVVHHYDLSDTLYELFLDADRQYSCAYYVSANDSLEQAQHQKKRHLAAKLQLEDGQRILDIGSGWGGLAIYLADVADVHVTGVTLSTEQHRHSALRAQTLGLDARVKFRLQDYRHETGRYDRIVSVGMFEHVGTRHYLEYFNKIHELLTDDGIALVHTIGRTDGPGTAHPWIEKYIFPGGYCPALSEILPAIEKAGLYVTDVEVLRLHYAETLKEWRRRFNKNRPRIAAVFDERFCRMWEFYLAGCEAGFRHGGLVNFQIQLTKRLDAAPLTRDYIAEWERSQVDHTLAAAPDFGCWA